MAVNWDTCDVGVMGGDRGRWWERGGAERVVGMVVQLQLSYASHVIHRYLLNHLGFAEEGLLQPTYFVGASNDETCEVVR